MDTLRVQSNMYQYLTRWKYIWSNVTCLDQDLQSNGSLVRSTYPGIHDGGRGKKTVWGIFIFVIQTRPKRRPVPKRQDVDNDNLMPDAVGGLLVVAFVRIHLFPKVILFLDD